MPRARNIKPSFFRDSAVVRCSMAARIAFIGLWCLADYKGRLKLDFLEIKLELFPADNVDVEKLIQELSDNGLIEIYTDHSGSALVQIGGFERHQHPHVNERQDKDKNPLPCLPSKEECESFSGEEKNDKKQELNDALRVLREYSESNRADSLLLIPDFCKLIPEYYVPPDGETSDHEKTDKEITKSSDVVATLTLNDKSEYPITSDDISQWQDVFPAVDVLQQLKKMQLWLTDNPTRRKTKSGIRKFISAWLGKEQDKGVSFYKTANGGPPQNKMDQIRANLRGEDTEIRVINGEVVQ